MKMRFILSQTIRFIFHVHLRFNSNHAALVNLRYAERSVYNHDNYFGNPTTGVCCPSPSQRS